MDTRVSPLTVVSSLGPSSARRARLPLAVLFTSAAMGEIIDVATAGHIVAHDSARPLLWLWGWDALVGLTALSVVGLVVDRVGPRRLTGLLSIGLGVIFMAAALAARANYRAWMVMSAISSVEYQVVPAAAWVLAYRHVRPTEGVHWFGRVDGLIWIVSAAAAALTGLVSGVVDRGAAVVLATAAGLTALGLVACFRPEAPRPGETPDARLPAMPARAVARWICDDPTLVAVVIFGLLNNFAFSIFMFWFLALTGAVSSVVAQVAFTYGLWRIGRILGSVVGSMFLSAPLFRRFGIRGLIVFQPLSLLGALLLMTFAPSVSTCLILGVTLAVVGSLEDPAIRALMMGVPERLRGRVSTLVHSVTVAAGNLLAVIALLATSIDGDVGGGTSMKLLTVVVAALLFGATLVFRFQRPSIRGALA